MLKCPLNLNEPPVVSEDCHEKLVQYVTMTKDNKTICRTKASNPPFRFPSVWRILNIKARDTAMESNLSRCKLHPSPENSYQKAEWPKFLEFLHQHKRVAIVYEEPWQYYVLPSDEFPKTDYATVLYERKHSNKNQEGGKSSETGKLLSTSVTEMHNRGSKRHSDFHDEDVIGDSGCSNGKRKKRLRQEKISSCLANMDTSNLVPSPCEDEQSSSQTMTKINNVFPSNFVKTDPSYLKTLSQTHAGWSFGAIAELVDNAKDANATRLDIFIENLYSKKEDKKVPVLSFVDDGHGMSYTEIVRMLSFGHKQPDEEDPSRVGRFGIGFKTGAMKLGRDALVFTQTSNSRSIAFLSQSYNENKEMLEIPIVTYYKRGNYMEVNTNIQDEACAKSNLKAIKDFSPFNEYFIGEKLGQFGELGTGTQIYIWNLDEWGSDYTLEWDMEKAADRRYQKNQNDILIRSKRVRSRPGQITKQVPLDYSLQAYLEVIFLNPRLKIYVQGSLVKSRPLAKSLNMTFQARGQIMGRPVELALGRSKLESVRMNAGIFLYWHGRLIEAYKRVGGQIHNADMGRGVIGVIDVTNLMDCENGDILVLNNKQGFQDCEIYAKLEEWLGDAVNSYWDGNFDALDVDEGDESYEPDHDWVQCNKCRKWRILDSNFDTESLPQEWFCYMPPFSRKCEVPEQQVADDVITVAAKRSAYDNKGNNVRHKVAPVKPKSTTIEKTEHLVGETSSKFKQSAEGCVENGSCQTEDNTCLPKLKRLRRGPARTSEQL